MFKQQINVVYVVFQVSIAGGFLCSFKRDTNCVNIVKFLAGRLTLDKMRMRTDEEVASGFTLFSKLQYVTNVGSGW